MESQHEKEFLEAFESHADALFRHAFFRVSDREKAHDLVQDTFLKTWDYVANGGEVRQYKSFLYRILQNLIIDSYRKKSSSSLDELLDNEATASATEMRLSEGSRIEVEESIDEKNLFEQIRSRIPDLPEHYRDAITMRFIDELSIAQIAEETGVSENVVSVRIHRAVAKLRELCYI